MNIARMYTIALGSFGYTEDEARFLYLVAAHSGYFTCQQFLRFIDGKPGKRSLRLKEPARSIATVLVLTGLRIGEILALRWKYVDLCRHTLRVAETVYDGHFDTPKSQRSARIVPLAEEACSTLGKLR